MLGCQSYHSLAFLKGRASSGQCQMYFISQGHTVTLLQTTEACGGEWTGRQLGHE